MAAEPPRHRALWLLGGVLVAWLVVQRVLHAPAPAPVVCERDLEPTPNTVVMLSASWCGYCRRARAWLTEAAIEYCEYDVETNPVGRAQFAALRHKVVPVLKIRGDTLVGFNPTEISQALAAHGITAFDE